MAGYVRALQRWLRLDKPRDWNTDRGRMAAHRPDPSFPGEPLRPRAWLCCERPRRRRRLHLRIGQKVLSPDCSSRQESPRTNHGRLDGPLGDKIGMRPHPLSHTGLAAFQHYPGFAQPFSRTTVTNCLRKGRCVNSYLKCRIAVNSSILATVASRARWSVIIR